MIRLTELRLPIDHDDAALTQAVADRLGVPVMDISDVTIFRRGHDARRRHRIMLVYTVDCAVRDEAAVLAAHDGARDIMPAPDTSYRFVVDDGPAMARMAGFVRPVVIGAGPCGLMAALVLAQMGLRPLVLERGKVVRERTVDTFALWRKSILNPESNVQFGEGGRERSRTASCTARSATPGITGARCWRNLCVRARRRKSSIFPVPISAPSALSRWWSVSAPRSRHLVANTVLARM
ncbi:uncharacterized protein S101446_02744 [Komagataeibacter europaeus]|nr:uncharacterized protein S101446_02744 [Komagataeibacter europaeus]